MGAYKFVSNWSRILLIAIGFRRADADTVTRIVHQNIDPAESLDRIFDRRPDLPLIRHVQLYRENGIGIFFGQIP